MSDYSYDRARRMRLIQDMLPKEKEDFKAEVRKELGLRDDQECDKACSILSDEQFKAMVDRIREKLKRKIRGESETEEKREVVQMYA